MDPLGWARSDQRPGFPRSLRVPERRWPRGQADGLFRWCFSGLVRGALPLSDVKVCDTFIGSTPLQCSSLQPTASEKAPKWPADAICERPQGMCERVNQRKKIGEKRQLPERRPWGLANLGFGVPLGGLREGSGEVEAKLESIRPL